MPDPPESGFGSGQGNKEAGNMSPSITRTWRGAISHVLPNAGWYNRPERPEAQRVNAPSTPRPEYKKGTKHPR